MTSDQLLHMLIWKLTHLELRISALVTMMEMDHPGTAKRYESFYQSSVMLGFEEAAQAIEAEMKKVKDAEWPPDDESFPAKDEGA